MNGMNGLMNHMMDDMHKMERKMNAFTSDMVNGHKPLSNLTTTGVVQPSVQDNSMSQQPNVDASTPSVQPVIATPWAPNKDCREVKCKYFMESVPYTHVHNISCNVMKCSNFMEHGCSEHSFNSN